MIEFGGKRRSDPEGNFAPMKWVNIKDLWYHKAASARYGQHRSFDFAWRLGKEISPLVQCPEFQK